MDAEKSAPALLPVFDHFQFTSKDFPLIWQRTDSCDSGAFSASSTHSAVSNTWCVPADEAGIGCICWCYLGAPHTRKVLGPPSTVSHTPDRTHVKLGDSWLVNNLERREAERSSQMARQKELNPQEGRLNHGLSRGNLGSPGKICRCAL